jgi:endonuclease/exonuclease/phosphatase family metal-dependent hydrolase
VLGLALVVVLALQSFRTLFPLLFAFGEDVSYYLAAGIGVVSFAAPILAWPLHRLLGLRLSGPVAVSALVVLRVLVQFLHPIPLWLAIAATGAALIALVLPSAAIGRRFALVVVLGLALDTAIRGAFLTWDVPWQEGVVPAIVALVLAAGALWSARITFRRGEREDDAGAGPWSTAALGVFLFLQVMFLQSPAFVASSAGYSLEGGLTVVLVADAAALGAVWFMSGRRIPTVLGVVAGVVLAAVAFGLTQAAGPVIALLVLVGQVVATGLFTMAVAPATRSTSVRRLAVGGAVGGVALAVLAAGYQIHYEIPLPFPNTLLPPVAGVLLGLAAFGRGEPRGGEPVRADLGVAAVPIALLIVPLGVLVARPDRSVEPAEGRSIRIVNYNIHQGLNPDGQVDPEATARTIEALRPDVVMLQEIGRGWPIHIFMDTGEWLSRRLNMPFLYQPAADRQFGNAIMTRLPIVEHDGGFLPFGEGPQRRSYLRARIGLEEGRSITLIDTHLQHQEDKPETRRAQIEEVLRVWGGEPRTVIAGDMNTQPGEANLDLFLDAGLVSVQDEAGLGHLPTATQETVRGDRVDYVFVTEGVSFRDVAVPYSFASDHLPIAVTVSVP